MAEERLEPDAVDVFVRRLTPGMVVVDAGRVEAVEEHHHDWFDVTINSTALSRPGSALVKVYVAPSPQSRTGGDG